MYDINFLSLLIAFDSALFKIFCKHDFCDEIRDSKIQEPEAAAPRFRCGKNYRSPRRLQRHGLDGLSVKMLH